MTHGVECVCMDCVAQRVAVRIGLERTTDPMVVLMTNLHLAFEGILGVDPHRELPEDFEPSRVPDSLEGWCNE